ncbi:hypothetical protein ACIQZG_09745 [Lysinibacillus sp. NPDC096418]|uniref:hypothetical protein n=1 Tax=Lysinibacillus sp. NPDC096418 TaxID=3364138 RepID=UPI0038290972
MTTLSTAWIDGKINDIDDLLIQNKSTKFLFILDTNFAIIDRYYITDIQQFKKHYKSQEKEFLKTIEVIKHTKGNVVYAFACEEAARSKITGNIDIDKYKLYGILHCKDLQFQSS